MKAGAHLLLILSGKACINGFLARTPLQRPSRNDSVSAWTTPMFSRLSSRATPVPRQSEIPLKAAEMSESHGASNGTPVERRQTITPLTWTDDFLFGVNYVHSRYLAILWRYSIIMSFAITLPFAILLWASHLYSVELGSTIYTILHRILYSILAVSLSAGGFLQLPLKFIKWTLSTLPTTITSILQYLPNFFAIHMVKALLFVQETIVSTSLMFTQNEPLGHLSTILAVLVWRPAIEEWQYRSILNKFLSAPGMIQRLPETIGSKALWLRSPVTTEPSSLPMVEFIPLTSGKEYETLPDDGGRIQTNGTIDGNDGGSDTSPINRSALPSVTGSVPIFLGSLLFATTRLGWLSSDPTADDLYSSPYGWTIGFLQSIRTHFSSHVLVEVRPSVQIWILLLAIHQAVSTFLVAQHIFANLYRQRGLAASVGAHIAWTVGKGTIGFRLLWRLMLGVNQWRVKYADRGKGAHTN